MYGLPDGWVRPSLGASLHARRNFVRATEAFVFGRIDELDDYCDSIV